jgi:hypothetical protein
LLALKERATIARPVGTTDVNGDEFPGLRPGLSKRATSWPGAFYVAWSPRPCNTIEYEVGHGRGGHGTGCDKWLGGGRRLERELPHAARSLIRPCILPVVVSTEDAVFCGVSVANEAEHGGRR